MPQTEPIMQIREGGASTGFRKGSFFGFFGTYLGKDEEESNKDE